MKKPKPRKVNKKQVRQDFSIKLQLKLERLANRAYRKQDHDLRYWKAFEDGVLEALKLVENERT